MKKIFKKLINVLNKKEKSKLYSLQFFNITNAIIEIILFSALALFISLVSFQGGGEKKLVDLKYLENLFDLFNIYEFSEKIIFLGTTLILIFILSLTFNIFVNWFNAKFIFLFNKKIIKRVFEYSIDQHWLYFTKNSVVNIAKNISVDCSTVTQKIIIPSLNLISKIFVTISIIFVVSAINLKVAFGAFVIFSIMYFLLLFISSKSIKKNSKEDSYNRQFTNKIVLETFSGIKEIKLFNLENHFKKIFFKILENNILPQTKVHALANIPRYFVEFIAYASVILFIIISLTFSNDSTLILPTIALYGFAGLKLLPAFQQMYLAIVNIKSGKIFFKNIESKLNVPKTKSSKTKLFRIKKNIKFNRINFNYELFERKSFGVKNISLTFKKNLIYGIVGKTGSGKTTLVDILTGLIKPSSGKILVDGKALRQKSISKWRKNFSLVPQNPFFSNSSIKTNVAIGQNNDEINEIEILNCLKDADLNNLISKLNNGIETSMGHHGLKFSGGERQRIAIARALYMNKDVIIFDEATSALDNITERVILKTIEKIKKNRIIIIITHRTNTLKICDKIAFINNGKIEAQGNYNELMSKNKNFREIANQKY